MIARPHASPGWLSSLGASLVLAVLLTTVMAVNGGLSLAEASPLFVGNVVLSLCITVSIQLGFTLASRVVDPSRLPRALRLGLSALALLALVALGIELSLWLLRALPEASAMFPRDAVRIVALPVSLVMVAIGAREAQRASAQQAREEALEQLSRARLTALSARTHPHFLFNALNSIAAIIEDDPRAGERAVLELARLFRYVLEGSDADLVPLGKELDFVRGYLALESLRFAERLDAALEVPGELESWPVPPLLLQPLVENAVRHGLAAQERLRVRITAREDGGELVLSVDDDGPGPAGSRHQGSGTSQEGLRTRLALAFGDAARLETERSSLGGFCARVRLPRGGA
jgi:two-component system sensor histidine kinase AlgZ